MKRLLAAVILSVIFFPKISRSETPTQLRAQRDREEIEAVERRRSAADAGFQARMDAVDAKLKANDAFYDPQIQSTQDTLNKVGFDAGSVNVRNELNRQLSSLRNAKSTAMSNLYSERSRISTEKSRANSDASSEIIRIQQKQRYTNLYERSPRPVNTPSWATQYRWTAGGGAEFLPIEDPAVVTARRKLLVDDYKKLEPILKEEQAEIAKKFVKQWETEWFSKVESSFAAFLKKEKAILDAEPEKVLRKRAGAPLVKLEATVKEGIDVVRKRVKAEQAEVEKFFDRKLKALLSDHLEEAVELGGVKTSVSNARAEESVRLSAIATELNSGWTQPGSSSPRPFDQWQSFPGVKHYLDIERKAFAPYLVKKDAMRATDKADFDKITADYVNWEPENREAFERWASENERKLSEEIYPHVRGPVEQKYKSEAKQRRGFIDETIASLEKEAARHERAMDDIFDEVDAAYENKISPEAVFAKVTPRFEKERERRPEGFAKLALTWDNAGKGEKVRLKEYKGAEELIRLERGRYPIRISPDVCKSFLYQMKLKDAETTVNFVDDKPERELLIVTDKKSFACHKNLAVLVTRAVALKTAKWDEKNEGLRKQVELATKGVDNNVALVFRGDTLIRIVQVPDSSLKIARVDYNAEKDKFSVLFVDPENRWVEEFAYHFSSKGEAPVLDRADRIGPKKEIWE